MPAQKTFNPMKKDRISRFEEDGDAEKSRAEQPLTALLIISDIIFNKIFL